MKKTIGCYEYLYNGDARPCRHVLTGRIDEPKRCMLNYECFHCAFDQWLDALEERKSAVIFAVAA